MSSQQINTAMQRESLPDDDSDTATPHTSRSLDYPTQFSETGIRSQFTIQEVILVHLIIVNVLIFFVLLVVFFKYYTMTRPECITNEGDFS
ncbi:hypothetical protein QE152_g27680 [Popillia japonica]|uniref:Uncharacterized protein n=1 Tax=Popillia japonica TaxID=7064 RepID=A0AAW1JUH5_POPJA